jgi:hypothetical protein
MGQEETHALQQNRVIFQIWLSGSRLIEQRLGLLPIERVETLGEPAVDSKSSNRSRKMLATRFVIRISYTTPTASLP